MASMIGFPGTPPFATHCCTMSFPEDDARHTPDELTRRSFLLSGAVASTAALPLAGRAAEPPAAVMASAEYAPC